MRPIIVLIQSCVLRNSVNTRVQSARRFWALVFS
jgi:hypothetical protein